MKRIRNIPITATLSYYKSHQSIEDILSDELGYSLIYDNIVPNRVGDALATVNLVELPSHFFLIQIDDYIRQSQQIEITREFFQKTGMIRMIRAFLSEWGIPGFVANLIGTDKITCFICAGAEKDNAGFFHDFSAALRERIRKRSQYTLSIAMSRYCTKLSDFPSEYLRMQQLLNESFFRKDRSYDVLYQVSFPRNTHSHQDRYSELLAAVCQNSKKRIADISSNIFLSFQEEHISPQEAKSQIIRLICRLEKYGISLNVPFETIHSITSPAISGISSSMFLEDIQALFWQYCEWLAEELARSELSGDYQFKLPVQEYLSEHYSRQIRLDEIARVFGFHPGYFSELFRNSFGITLTDYLIEYRVERAKRLLAQTNLSINEIAASVGFNSSSYFSRMFKKHCGASASSYRKQNRETSSGSRDGLEAARDKQMTRNREVP